MVKPDVKHNYYADLELPNSATIDEIRKSYRKLALQYHPDRNAGREAECVPKFQAIQAAHEVLGDPAIKAKYDQDRRKAGLFPTRPEFNTPGNPYSTNTSYPPPPRRTQAGTWQRPNPTTGPAPTGADRFANYPRPSNHSPRKEPATERTQQFRAWQRWNNTTDRPRNNDGRPVSPQPPPPTPPNGGRPRPQRQDTKLPSEDQIRAGMNYRKPPTAYNADNTERRQSAWQSFQQARPDEPGMKRSNTFRTPRKPAGFDPSAPGSDERPAPDAGTHYGHRHRSEDLGTPVNGTAFPPPPPGPPPHPYTPPRRASADPPRSNRRDEAESPDDAENVPYYATESRTSTPYSSRSGEKTRISSDSLRRSASTRNATKLPSDPNNASRARSTSPMGRERPASSAPQRFEQASNDSPPHVTDDGPAADRPKKTPVSRLRRYNSSNINSPRADPDGTTANPSLDNDRPGMQQRPGTQNMYASSPFFANPRSLPFDRNQWAANHFGSHSTSSQDRRALNVPPWAMPSSVCPRPSPGQRKASPEPPDPDEVTSSESDDSSTEGVLDRPMSALERAAHLRFCHELQKALGDDSVGIQEWPFLHMVAKARVGRLPNHDLLKSCLLLSLPMLLPPSPDLSWRKIADLLPDHSFNIPIYPDTFTSTANKSRSEENISTNFSSDGWTGSFTGTPGMPAKPSDGRKPSPARRPGQRPLQRAPTSDRSHMNTTPFTNMPPPPRPTHVTGDQPPTSATTVVPGEVKFSPTEWEKTFQDPSWSWPPPPPNPPPKQETMMPANATPKTQRQTGQAMSSSNGAANGTKKNPYVVDDNGAETAAPPTAHVEDDAMDIDSTPPSVKQANVSASNPPTPSQPEKEPRLYSVPVSNWRQQQGKQRPQDQDDRKGISANLDDLSHVEPLKNPGSGLNDFADLSSTLPFESKASATLPTHPMEPQKLQTPPVPKAPEAPSKLTKTSWHGYCQTFANYLQAFHAFNRTMLTHFDARERSTQAQMQLGMGWLEATGDTSGQISEPSGFGTYLKGVREDEHVREVWNVGFERHAEAVKEFDKIRERIRHLVGTNALLDH